MFAEILCEEEKRLAMLYILSATALAICGAFLIVSFKYRKKLLDGQLILAIFVLLLAGMNLAKFFQG